MKNYIVCDAGGTKTEFLLFTENGLPLAYSKRSGANAIFIGKAASTNAVVQGIKDCLKKANLNVTDLDSISLFIPGFKACKTDVEHELGKEVSLAGDEENAIYAAHGRPYGIAALCGTGSFVIGQAKCGMKAVSGGWGPLFGDDGSGYHIGVLCLKKLAWLYDNRISETMLEKLALAFLKAPSVQSIRSLAYNPGYSRETIAGLCQIVAMAAREGDVYSLDILRVAAYAIVSDVQTVARRLNNEPLQVAVTGGVAKIGYLFTDYFKAAVEENCPFLSWREQAFEPVIGAALKILDEKTTVDIENRELVKRISNYKVGDIVC